MTRAAAAFRGSYPYCAKGDYSAIDADCNKRSETLYTGAFEIEPALAVSA
jgi:hypothetical protein